MGIRDGIKTFTNWPTIPQLYVKGEFVGGCDIVREMFQDGELQQLHPREGHPAHQPRPSTPDRRAQAPASALHWPEQ